MWSNNGIIILLQLMEFKTPITDADCIRGIACRALASIAHSTWKISFFNGQLQFDTWFNFPIPKVRNNNEQLGSMNSSARILCKKFRNFVNFSSDELLSKLDD